MASDVVTSRPGRAAGSRSCGPEAVAVDTAGNVYITDPHNNQVVKLPPR
jgi:DNA-binding beta-propeller fold protein YncE